MKCLVAAIALSFACPAVSDEQAPASDLLFTSTHEGNSEIYLLPAAGGDWINLSNHPGPDNWGVWSPDGQRIAFQTRRNGKLDVYVMNADGSAQQRLTDHPEHDYLPAWTPDGKQITFTSWRSEPGDHEPKPHIYIMDADGSDQRRFLTTSPGTSTDVQWLADGNRFLLPRKRGDQASDLWLHDLRDGSEIQLTDNDHYEGSPSLSPDQQWIALYVSQDGGANIDLMRIDGSERFTLLEHGWNWNPRFHPSEDWLVFNPLMGPQEEDNIDIYAIRASAGAKAIPLIEAPGRQAEPMWRPGQ